MRWVGLVRNVMLGREGVHRQVLLDLAEAGGGVDVRSHLTTGNLTFSVASRAGAEAVARHVEHALADVLGRPEPVVLREHAWLADLVARDPFAGLHDQDVELEVGFLPLDADPLDPSCLRDPSPTVLVEVHDREVLTARPREGRRRPHVVPLLQEATGARATARGWSTLQRIVMAGA